MKQYVLVHGAGHGAWCWYKVKPALEASGHRVTLVGLMASGVNMSKMEDVLSLEDYTKPLLDVLESFGSEDKVILVAHSLGGLSVALAADMFPSKISVAVFVTSFMPDTTNPPSYVFGKHNTNLPEEAQKDSENGYYGPKYHPLMTVTFKPRHLITSLYQLSPIEDFELAKTLVRVGPAATSNLTGTKSLTEEGYGSVARVYIVCREDKCIPEDFQPLELCDRLLKIADKYA